MTKLARNTDPETAKLSGRGAETSRIGLYPWVLECVRKTPGKTQGELGKLYCPNDPRKIGRRLNEMVPQFIKRGPVRKCTVSGKLCETWWPADDDSSRKKRGLLF